jgi:hypothetical protein
MIAANDVTALFLQAKQVPFLRHVVRTPKRWDRIVEVAAEHNFKLPAEPDPVALSNFLIAQRAVDPLNSDDQSTVFPVDSYGN